MYVRAEDEEGLYTRHFCRKCWMAEGIGGKNSGITGRRLSELHAKTYFKPACKVTKEDGRSAVLLQYVIKVRTPEMRESRLRGRGTSVRQGSLQEEKA